jgi:hypothetical protein
VLELVLELVVLELVVLELVVLELVVLELKLELMDEFDELLEELVDEELLLDDDELDELLGHTPHS